MTLDEDQPATFGSTLEQRQKRPLTLLPATKTMRLKAKNDMEKLARLRSRFLRLGQDDTLVKKKKHFQFRLVGVDSIPKASLEQLETEIAGSVMTCLKTDITSQIQALESSIPKLP